MCAASLTSARKIALIGSTGFIGQHLARQLLARGDQVLALVRPSSPRRAELPAGVEVREVQLTASDPRLAAAIEEADAIIYAAGAVRGRELADFLPANVHGVAAVAARLSAARPLVLLSSLAASEPNLSHYAHSKRLGELVLETEAVNRRWTILRPTAVYGLGDRELRPMLGLMRRGLFVCPAGPQQRLSFIHVDDVVCAVLAVLDHPGAVLRQTYTLDDGMAGGYGRAALAASLRPKGRLWCLRIPGPVLTLAGHASLVSARLFDRQPMLTPGKVRELTHPAWLGNNGPFTAATGWTPRHDLATGVEALFAPSTSDEKRF